MRVQNGGAFLSTKSKSNTTAFNALKKMADTKSFRKKGKKGKPARPVIDDPIVLKDINGYASPSNKLMASSSEWIEPVDINEKDIVYEGTWVRQPVLDLVHANQQKEYPCKIMP